ncbi:hypothetical protein TNCV_3424421 [Trichonephila clavipes]|nr:hypothetical protein TNCV_3424421 [Trichonephila clavipes]
MAPYRRRKPASTEYATDEEDMITYDVEEEFEPNPDLVEKDGKQYWRGSSEALGHSYCAQPKSFERHEIPLNSELLVRLGVNNIVTITEGTFHPGHREKEV